MFRKPRHVVFGIALLAIVVLLTPSVNLSRFRRGVASALGTALGRRVEVGGVHVELLPLPAIVAENVVIGELPEVGAEPIARMSELRATPRLRSLWNGKAEVSSVVLVEPSVNLARAHFAQPETGAAETAMPAVVTLEKSPAAGGDFPYIEVRDGRINFKRDDIKSIFFFSDVQGALYRENGAIYLRFRGRPARTDRALTGAGEVRVEGQILPRLDLQTRLTDAFLNDLLALVRGADPGIQGQFSADMRVSGRPAALRMEGRASVADLHRGDFLPPVASAPLQVTFSGSADLPARRLDIAEIRSEAGTVTAFGGVQGFLQSNPGAAPFTWDLQVRMNSVDGGRWFSALQHFSPRLSGDLQISGLVDGRIHFMPGTNEPSADGELIVENLAIRAGGGPAFTAPSAQVQFEGPIVRVPTVLLMATGEHPLSLGLAANWTTPAQGPRTVQVTAVGQNLSAATVSRIAAALGWPGGPTVGRVSLNAKATLESGSPPALSGAASVEKATWPVRWLSQPLQIHTLRVEMAPKHIRVSDVVAQIGETMITGSAERTPDPMGKPRWQADLRANQLSAAGLAGLLAADNPAPEWLASFQATGKVAAAYLHLKALAMQDLTSTFSIGDRTLVLRDARANLAGGRVNGTVEIDFARPAPVYHARVKLADVQTGGFEELAQGTISGSLDLKTQGRTAAQLADSFEMQGAFSGRTTRIMNAALADSLQTDRTGAWSADVDVHSREVHFKRLAFAGPPAMEATGSVGFNRSVNLDFQTFRVTGTLAEPQRVSANELAAK